MLSIPVTDGALFYVEAKRHKDISFSQASFRAVKDLTAAVRELLENGVTPPPQMGRHCESCSLKSSCLPEAVCKWGVRYLRDTLSISNLPEKDTGEHI